MTSQPPSIQAERLGKRYGQRWVLRDVDLHVSPGQVLGLLGPNGAGKTTTVRILSTLIEPDAGSARVAGYDVVREARHVRPRIGVAGQAATVDGLLTGRANLAMIGQLYHLRRRDALARADELLARFDLEDAGDQLVKTYSGGMRRRLDLAGSLVASPPVLFLDEPTTGLDPRGRSELWGVLRGLVRDGTTLLLTTQYLEEADRLADTIVVIDHGRAIATGTPAELKARVGGERIVLSLADGNGQLAHAASVLRPFAREEPQIDASALQVTAPIAAGATLADVLRALDAQQVPTTDIARRSPTLDDVFFALTGHDTHETDEEQER